MRDKRLSMMALALALGYTGAVIVAFAVRGVEPVFADLAIVGGLTIVGMLTADFRGSRDPEEPM